jgi:guanyl-specific ribonuclease Sa
MNSVWGGRIRAAVVTSAAAVAIGAGTVLGAGPAAAAVPAVPASTVSAVWFQPGHNRVHANVPVPQRAWDTLGRIQAGTWPPDDGSGTKGGTQWYDRDGSLPRTDAGGNPIQYQEWDVNERQPGQHRDAERIITGSDGSAWYTADHYRTFTRMR